MKPQIATKQVLASIRKEFGSRRDAKGHFSKKS